MPRTTRTPLDQLQPQRICLIKPSALGDVVQTLPLLSQLRSRWPQAHIAWVVNRSLAGILQGHPELDAVIEFDRGARGARAVATLASLSRRLKCERFDLTLDLQGLFRSGWMTWWTRAERRVGFSLAREGARFAYTDQVPAVWEMPNWARYLLLGQALGCSDPPPRGVVPVTQEHRDWALAQLRGLPRPWLVVHPGAQWETKRWPPAHFVRLLRQAQMEFNGGVVLLGGPGERPLTEIIASELPGPVVNLAERTRLLPLAATIEQADVFLSGDTGPMHLSAALGRPTVSLFTCTSTLQAGPRGAEEQIVATGVACAASYLRRCRTLACMDELTPERVWPTLRRELLQAAGSTRRTA